MPATCFKSPHFPPRFCKSHASLSFARVALAKPGRPAYQSAVLPKRYIYGSLKQIQSSRGLGSEAQRSIELMWLIRRLAPDRKTIAHFHKDNGKAICNVCRQFVVLC
jgi:transposase